MAITKKVGEGEWRVDDLIDCAMWITFKFDFSLLTWTLRIYLEMAETNYWSVLNLISDIDIEL